MNTNEIFEATIKKLGIVEEEIYFERGHLTPLGLAIFTASMFGSGELKSNETRKTS